MDKIMTVAVVRRAANHQNGREAEGFFFLARSRRFLDYDLSLPVAFKEVKCGLT